MSSRPAAALPHWIHRMLLYPLTPGCSPNHKIAIGNCLADAGELLCACQNLGRIDSRPGLGERYRVFRSQAQVMEAEIIHRPRHRADIVRVARADQYHAHPVELLLLQHLPDYFSSPYDNRRMTSVRMDKWLWAARFFKTRALASRACELGRIQSNGQLAKPARSVAPGDRLRIKNDGGEFEVEVLLLSEVRGPAAVAQTLYRETDASREQRQKLAQEKKALQQFEQLPEGRPSKRDRRQINRLRGRI